MMFEAARIANAVFILVGRGMKHHVSILNQLSIQNDVTFVASNGNHITGNPLVAVGLEKVKENHWIIEARPIHDGVHEAKRMQFDEWWQQCIFTDDVSKLSRCELIRVMRDRDGGSHYDPEIRDEKTRDILNGRLGIRYRSGDGVERMVPWWLHTMVRKVGEELISSVKYLEIAYDAPHRGYTFLDHDRFQKLQAED